MRSKHARSGEAVNLLICESGHLLFLFLLFTSSRVFKNCFIMFSSLFKRAPNYSPSVFTSSFLRSFSSQSQAHQDLTRDEFTKQSTHFFDRNYSKFERLYLPLIKELNLQSSDKVLEIGFFRLHAIPAPLPQLHT